MSLLSLDETVTHVRVRLYVLGLLGRLSRWSRVRHVEQLQSESCCSGKKCFGHIARMPTVCRAASALLAPFSDRRFLVPVRSRFRSLIKALAPTQHGTTNSSSKGKNSSNLFGGTQAYVCDA